MKRPILAVLVAFTALSLAGCASALGVTEKPLGIDEYRRLRASPDFAPAWAQPAARPFILDALDTVNRLETERDTPK